MLQHLYSTPEVRLCDFMSSVLIQEPLLIMPCMVCFVASHLCLGGQFLLFRLCAQAGAALLHRLVERARRRLVHIREKQAAMTPL